MIFKVSTDFQIHFGVGVARTINCINASSGVKSQNLNVTRAFDEQPSLIHLARYKTLSHKKASPNPDRMQVIKEGSSRFKTDGLVDLRYKRLYLQFKPLYTHVLVDIQPHNITNITN
jgi:hypothetical protein